MVKQISAQLAAFSLGNLCDASKEIRAMHPSIRPLFSGARMAGPALTARVAPGQNAAVHRAVHSAQPGDVLVVDGSGSSSSAIFGDILATACQRKGVAGAVLDGAIRDSAEIRALGFPVFCLGVNPSSPSKADPGEIQIEITCGGVRVQPGDFVVGSDDGVVVIPRRIATEVLERARAVVEKETKVMEQLAAGRSTVDIFGMDP